MTDRHDPRRLKPCQKISLNKLFAHDKRRLTFLCASQRRSAPQGKIGDDRTKSTSTIARLERLTRENLRNAARRPCFAKNADIAFQKLDWNRAKPSRLAYAWSLNQSSTQQSRLRCRIRWHHNPVATVQAAPSAPSVTVQMAAANVPSPTSLSDRRATCAIPESSTAFRWSLSWLGSVSAPMD